MSCGCAIYPFNRCPYHSFDIFNKGNVKTAIASNYKSIRCFTKVGKDDILLLSKIPSIDTISILGYLTEVCAILRYPNIKHLKLTYGITMDSVIDILYSNHLESLSIPYDPDILPIISSMTGLRLLCLRGRVAGLKMEDARFICLMKNLRVLDIETLYVSDNVLQYLLDHGSFNVLYLGKRERIPMLRRIRDATANFLGYEIKNYPSAMTESKFTQPWPYLVIDWNMHENIRNETINKKTNVYIRDLDDFLKTVFPAVLAIIITEYVCFIPKPHKFT